MGRRNKRRSETHIQQQLLNTFARLHHQLRAVGSTPGEQLQWLETFVRRDPFDRAIAAQELNMLLLHHYTAWGADFNSAADIQAFVTPDDVAGIQGALKTLLDGLKPDAYVWFSHPIGDGLRWHPDQGVSLVTRSVASAQVFAAVGQLLIGIGPRLRRCKTSTCQKLFTANRPGQVRCTKTCGEAERQRAWRHAHREQYAERQHQQYAKRVRAHRPRVRVTRRTRRKAE
jgi:hypothetical protein